MGSHVHPLGHGQGMIVVLLAVLTLPAASQARSTRDKSWLVAYVRQPPVDSPRRDRYLRILHERILWSADPKEKDYCGVDVAWLRGGSGRGLEPARRQLNALARLAYAHAAKGCPYHQDPQAWQRVRDGLLGVAGNVCGDGSFAWGVPHPSHEHAWLLESSLLAFIWAEDYLSAAEREKVREALYRAAAFIAKDYPNTESNQGSVRAAVVALAALYFEKPEWMAVADRQADAYLLPPRGNIYDDGEIGEHFASYGNGGGPDSNYTYTGLAYIYAYRLWSGREEIDPVLNKAARWLVGYSTLSGWDIVPGASARIARANWSRSPNCLPFFEMMSRSEPFYARLAELALATYERGGHIGSHLVTPFLWAAREAGARDDGAEPPYWQINRTELYGPPQRQAVSYGLFSRAYQTGVVFSNGVTSSRAWPLRGLQVWAWNEEPPVIASTEREHSFTLAGGVNTAETNVELRGAERELLLEQGPLLPAWRSNLATITARRGSVVEVYALTPLSFVVAYCSAGGEIRTTWAVNRRAGARASLDPAGRVLSFAGREGRIHILAGAAALVGGQTLEVVTPGPVSAFGFSNTSFAFAGYDREKQVIAFADASGQYALSVADLLDRNGCLNRASAFRLKLTASAPAPANTGSAY